VPAAEAATTWRIFAGGTSGLVGAGAAASVIDQFPPASIGAFVADAPPLGGVVKPERSVLLRARVKGPREAFAAAVWRLGSPQPA